MTKRLLALCLALLMPIGALAEAPLIGVSAYSGTDTFILSLLAQLSEQAGERAHLRFAYAQGDQNRQYEQLIHMMDEGAQVLLCNPVDRVSAVYLIALAAQRDVPLILFNRQPLKEDLESYDKAYYVGIDPKEQGRLQAQLMRDYFAAHPEGDLSGDGIVQYVLLRGEPGHQDAELRSLYFQRELSALSFATEKLGEETAYWEKAQGQERMAALISRFGNAIECVVSNNDDMALGAIDALKAAGMLGAGRDVPVIGVDATQPALDMIAQGSLYGTVQNDAATQAKALVELALLLSEGLAITADSYDFQMDHRMVYIPSRALTRDNLPPTSPE